MKNKFGVVAKGNIEFKIINRPDNIKPNENEVNSIWKTEKNRLGDALFDGTFFCLTDITYQNNTYTIEAYPEKYRYLVANQIDPILELNITPMGVSGVCIIKEENQFYLVFARRSNNVFFAPNMLELVPSGMIDEDCREINGKYNPELALRKEFVEETGLDEDYINQMKPLYIIKDEDINSCDICFMIELSCSKEKILNSIKHSPEYNDAICIAFTDLKDYLLSKKDEMIKTSYYFTQELMKEDINFFNNI